MSQSLDLLQQQLRSLRLAETAKALPSIMKQAETDDWTYMEFLQQLVGFEQKRR